MRAEQAAVSNMVKLEMDELCDDCPLKEQFTGDVFLVIGGRSASGLRTEMQITDGEDLGGYIAEGVVRPSDVMDSFDNCEHSVENGIINSKKLICGALARLENGKRR